MVTFATVDSEPGAVISIHDVVVSVMEFVTAAGRIVAIHSLADADRLARLDVAESWRPPSSLG